LFLGGLFFQTHAFTPFVKSDPGARSLWVKVLRQFRRIAWATILLLVLTGLGNLSRLPQAPVLFGSSAGRLLVLKLGLTILILFIYAHRDFGVTSRMIRVLESDGDPASLQRVMSWLDRIVLLLGITVLLLGLEVSHRLR
jgi:putative copper export protein